MNDVDDASLSMRETWDALARRNAMHFIATERPEWEPDEFLESGEQAVERLLQLAGHEPQGTALDLGCGVGRLTFALAERFERAIGVDVSQEMIGRARALSATLARTNVEFLATNGVDLAIVPTSTCDFVFSYIVLQHIPDPLIVHGYVRELGRVLKPGGHALFQVPVYRAVWQVPPWRLVQATFRRLLAPAERLGLVPPERGLAFRGSRITAADLGTTLAQAELETLAIIRTPSTYRFCDDALVYAVRR